MCERNGWCCRLFGGRGVFGDGLGTFRHGVLGEFTGQNQSDGCLDLSGADGGFLVVGGELGSLSGDAFKDIWLRISRQVPNAIQEEKERLPLTKEFRMDMARLEIPVSG